MAASKAGRHRDRFGPLYEHLLAVFRMLKAFATKRYKPSWRTLVTAAVVVLYIASPIDFIPDFILGLGMRIVGTTEGDCNVAAGRTGFRPVITSAEDAALHHRLRQHAWEPAWRERGHDGGHFGSTQPDFLQSHVVPLLQAPGAYAG